MAVRDRSAERGLKPPDPALAGERRLVSIDGMVFDLPDTDTNTAEFGKPTGGVFPQARVVTLTETASHVSLDAEIGPITGKGTGERSAAHTLLRRLEPDMLLLADAGFYSFDLWCKAIDTGADVLWRLGDIMDLPVVASCGDGSYLTLLFDPATRPEDRAALLVRARAGDDLTDDAHRVRVVRVVEYDVPGHGSGELICLLTSILGPRDAPAKLLAHTYHFRWQHEEANKEIKNQLRGPGRILRSQSPDMVRQELYGFLIAHYAVCAMICQGAVAKWGRSRTVIDRPRLSRPLSTERRPSGVIRSPDFAAFVEFATAPRQPPKPASTLTGSSSPTPSASSRTGSPIRTLFPLTTNTSYKPGCSPRSPPNATSTPRRHRSYPRSRQSRLCWSVDS